MICEKCGQKILKDWDIDSYDNVMPIEKCGCNG